MSRYVIACALVLLVASAADGHTRDEYVQALRVAVTPARVTLHCDLTVGMTIAGEVIRRIDTNGDGVLSPIEAEAYGRAVMADLALTIDGAERALALARAELPSVEAMREGEGVIRLQAEALGAEAIGEHQLVVTNRHLPSISVYLANALQPDGNSVRINQQTRDRRQQVYMLAYEVRGASGIAIVWSFVAISALFALAALRLRWPEKVSLFSRSALRSHY